MPFNVSYHNEAIEVLLTLDDWFFNISEWIPPAPGWVSDLLFGRLPEDNYADVYPFAEQWLRYSEHFGDFLDGSVDAGQKISSDWSGDGTAAQFGLAFHGLTMAIADLQMATAQMSMDISMYGLQLEIGSYAFVLNIILLAIMLIVDIIMIALWGIGLVTALGRFAATRLAQTAVMRSIIAAIKGIIPRAVGAALRAAPRRALGALPRPMYRGLVKLGRPGATRAGGRVAAGGTVRGVGNVGARGMPVLARGAVRGTVGTRGSIAGMPLRALGRGVVRTIARATARHRASGLARVALGRLAAGGTTRLAGRGAQLAERALQRQITNAVRDAIARKIVARFSTRMADALFREGAETIGQRVAGRLAVEGLERAGVNGARDITGRVVSTAVREGMELGRGQVIKRMALEWAKGIPMRAAAGFVLGGGINLGAQVWALNAGEGPRFSDVGIDVSQVLTSAAHTAAFLGIMGGKGIVMHTFTGSVAGAVTATADQVASWAQGKGFDLGKVGEGAVHGAAIGAAFGAYNKTFAPTRAEVFQTAKHWMAKNPTFAKVFGQAHVPMDIRLPGEVRIFEMRGPEGQVNTGVRYEGARGIAEYDARGGTWQSGQRTTAFVAGEGGRPAAEYTETVRGDRHMLNIGKDLGSMLLREPEMRIPSEAPGGGGGGGGSGTRVFEGPVRGGDGTALRGGGVEIPAQRGPVDGPAPRGGGPEIPAQRGPVDGPAPRGGGP
ncbi:WXG100-like domain-containing protein, partial [Virgisporangium ochraceum]|uniref:WXG100-like domain-containing protein n=1 Tax=Virgisporangium ochraceum TaxID=65505 RepID=UPI00403A7DE0